MKQCKCEHWQQCPVCMPHRFDAEGNLLPPEPTPLQSARAEIEALNQRLFKLQNAAREALDALEGVLDRNPGEKILEMTITGGLYEVVQVRDAIKSLQCALSAPYSDIESDGGMDPRNKCEQVAKAQAIRPKGKRNNYVDSLISAWNQGYECGLREAQEICNEVEKANLYGVKECAAAIRARGEE